MVADIHLGGVSKTFPAKAGKVEALGGIELDVAQHEFVSVLGPSGCGKSTLLRIVAGLIPPSGGEVLVHGQKVDGPSSKVGIVFQSPVLLPWRTVLQNIELQVEVRKLDRATFRDKARKLISLVGLEGFADSYPYQLSGGMQQRVSLCRALIHDPTLLLMDEPFGALDALTREQMGLELQRIWLETKKTVLFITHSIAEAVFLSDRIVVMSARPGRIQEIVTVNIPRPRTLDAMKDSRFHQAVDRSRKLMNAAGLPE
ncbi:MAG: ABC transporter ATP-binding protein [Alphaproteobacteria bacterium]